MLCIRPTICLAYHSASLLAITSSFNLLGVASSFSSKPIYPLPAKSSPQETTSRSISMNMSNGHQHHHHHHHTRHFVFGYGSLICPESRSVTNPGLADKESALPVVIQDVERVWSARTSSGYTAMGVRFAKGTECTGVLIEVNAKQLEDLDKREANYNRFPIHLDNIDQVPFLEQDEFYDEDHPVFEAKESTGSSSNSGASTTAGDHHASDTAPASAEKETQATTGKDDDDDESAEPPAVKVWIYIQQDPIPADPSHPIPQSYVDIIIRGCLTISEDFAKSFVETTSGWTHEQDHWVDDRSVPIYKRADPEFSNEHGDKIDAILEQHEPQALEDRVEYDPVDHLEALADALEDNMAHPRAIKQVAQRLREVSTTITTTSSTSTDTNAAETPHNKDEKTT